MTGRLVIGCGHHGPIVNGCCPGARQGAATLTRAPAEGREGRRAVGLGLAGVLPAELPGRRRSFAILAVVMLQVGLNLLLWATSLSRTAAKAMVARAFRILDGGEAAVASPPPAGAGPGLAPGRP